jgi:molybdopterin-binding protein
MKLSARNQLKGKVVEVRKGVVTASVKVDIGGGNVVTAIVSVEAVEELGLEPGKETTVIVKATEVMLTG